MGSSGPTNPVKLLIGICGVLSGILIFPGDIAFIANVTNFTLFITFIVINAAVIVLSITRHPTPRGHFVFPAQSADYRWFHFGIVFCIFLLAVQDLAVSTLGAHWSWRCTYRSLQDIMLREVPERCKNKVISKLPNMYTLGLRQYFVFEMSGHLPWQKNPERTYWQFVIGLGFILRALDRDRHSSSGSYRRCTRTLVDTVYSDPAIRSLFLILPTILLFLSILGAYPGGDFWAYSVILAYLAGLFILVSTVTALVFFGAAHHYRVSRARSPSDKKNDGSLTFAI